MPPRSSPSITSTTKRAKCLSGSHSSTDGGRRNAVSRSTSRKLLIASKPPFTPNQWSNSSEYQRRWVKSDRLLVRPPEGNGLADVLAGAECIQDEAGDVGSRNRRRDGARADPCGVAAGACSRRQAGRTDDGVVEAALTDRCSCKTLSAYAPRRRRA